LRGLSSLCIACFPLAAVLFGIAFALPVPYGGVGVYFFWWLIFTRILSKPSLLSAQPGPSGFGSFARTSAQPGPSGFGSFAPSAQPGLSGFGSFASSAQPGQCGFGSFASASLIQIYTMEDVA
jgi:hypothetical protein